MNLLKILSGLIMLTLSAQAFAVSPIVAHAETTCTAYASGIEYQVKYFVTTSGDGEHYIRAYKGSDRFFPSIDKYKIILNEEKNLMQPKYIAVGMTSEREHIKITMSLQARADGKYIGTDALIEQFNPETKRYENVFNSPFTCALGDGNAAGSAEQYQQGSYQ